jgi:azurin
VLEADAAGASPVAAGNPKKPTWRPAWHRRAGHARRTVVRKPGAAGRPGVRRIDLRRGDQLKFDVTRFTVKPGETVEIVLMNPDIMPHNLVIIAPGTLESVGAKAEAMASLPDGFQKNFVPATPEVLYSTKLISQGALARIRVTAPTAPGAYPYLCTFPGHWRVMNGIMEVRP